MNQSDNESDFEEDKNDEDVQIESKSEESKLGKDILKVQLIWSNCNFK